MKKIISHFFILMFFYTTLMCQNPKAILIGATGKQGQEYFNLLKDKVEFIAFVVSANNLENATKENFLNEAIKNNIKILRGIEELDKAITNKEIDFEIALLSVPHFLHDKFTKLLLKAKKTIIKEKPLALNNQEVIGYEKISKSKALPIFTIVQRHFQSSLVEAKKHLPLIGLPESFLYEYSFNLPSVTAGWRANKLKSGGGVVIDMGYHIIDVINNFFRASDIDTINAVFSFYHDEMLKSKLEDMSVINLNYKSGLKGEVKLSRHDNKKEKFTIKGSLGIIEIDPTGYSVYNLQGATLKSYKTFQSKNQNTLDMLDAYIQNRHNEKYINHELYRHKNNVAVIEQIYKIAKWNNSIMHKDSLFK